MAVDDAAIRLALDGVKEQLAQQDNRILGLTLEMEQKRKQLVSSIELLELDLQSTQVKHQRFQTLRKSGAVSGEDMLTAELNVKRTEIQLRQQRELIEDGKPYRAVPGKIEEPLPKSDSLKKGEPKVTEGERKIEIPLPSDRDMDRMMSFLERAWRRLIEMANRVQRDIDGKI